MPAALLLIISNEALDPWSPLIAYVGNRGDVSAAAGRWEPAAHDAQSPHPELALVAPAQVCQLLADAVGQRALDGLRCFAEATVERVF
jgi:hypothetical protein